MFTSKKRNGPHSDGKGGSCYTERIMMKKSLVIIYPNYVCPCSILVILFGRTRNTIK